MPNSFLNANVELNSAPESSEKTPPRRLVLWEGDSEASEESEESIEQTVEALPWEVRRRVSGAKLSARCLIENVSSLRAVEYAYCVPEMLPDIDDTLTCLEYLWGMKYLSLNLDTRYNIFRVGASLHAMFDNSMWMPVPEEDTINRFLSSIRRHGDRWYAIRSAFPKFQEKSFKYHFVPISAEMKAITIPRQNEVETNVQPSDVTVHFYPFQTLPLLESHLHPQFVIFEAGRKLAAFKDLIGSLMVISQEASTALERLVSSLRAQWPAVKQIERIYQAWTQKLDLGYILADPEFNPPPVDAADNGNAKDNDSLCTPPRKRQDVDPEPATLQYQNLPFGFGSSHQLGRENMPFNSRNLSTRALQSFNQGREKAWTKDSIAAWSANCTPDETEDDGSPLAAATDIEG